MKRIFLCLALAFPILSFGQTNRVISPHLGKTTSAENPSERVMPLLQQAQMQYRSFDFEETLFTLENAVAQNPNSPEALLFRAKFKKRMGLETEANLDYQLAHKLNPYVADLYGYYGNSSLLNLLSIEPGRAIQKLTTYQKLNSYYQAIDKKIAADKTADTEIELLYGAVQALEANELVKATNLLEKVIRSYPKSAIAYDLKGIVEVKENKLENAKFYFNKAILLAPDYAIAWYNLGCAEFFDHNYGIAKEYLSKAIELQESLTKAYFERALVYKAMGDFQNALADYDKIIELKETMYVETFLNRALTKKMAGDFNGALMDLNQIVTEYPDKAELRKNRGNLHLLFGSHINAIVDYTEAINLKNDDAEAYYNRALAHFQSFDRVSACADMAKSIELGYE